MSASIPVQEFEQFIFGEVRCIDERRWDDWLALFDEDGDYWIPLSPDDENPNESLSIAYEDRTKLALRCRRYSHPLAHSQIPVSRTSHMVSNVMLDDSDDKADEYRIYAQFTMREYRQNKRVDWDGTFFYQLRKNGDSFKIKRKTILLVDSDAELETIHVPF